MANLTISPKQKEILKVLEDDKHTEIFMGGAAGGCGVYETPVHTLTTERVLGELKKGDLVLTFNKEKCILEYKPVLETFINGGSVRCIKLIFKDGKEIKFTESHKFLFNGEWIGLGEFIRGSLEKSSRNEWKEKTGSRIWSPDKHYQGHYKKKKLEAREIDFNDVIEIEFYWQNEPMYDIETENESYVLGNGIIVHNSKSFTGCLWQIKRRIEYAGSRGFLARARLKSLKESTLLTFFEVAKMLGLKQGKDFTYNAISGVITFKNGSTEYLRDLFYYPSDPEFVALGSTEYTDGFIDEMGEIGEQAYQIIRSRIRFKLDEFGLIPKIAMGSNPCKTFIYKEFYKRYRDNELEHYKSYIPASVYDNPFISEHYIENLKKLDPINKARLLEGNWEYDDDPTKLFEYDAILDMFTLDAQRGKKYCIVDAAGFGRDKTVIGLWDGLFCYKVIVKDNISGNELDEILLKEKIPRSQCLVDELGVGFGLVKDLSGVKGFVANARPIAKKKETDKDKLLHNYKNLKAQCWFELANYVNSGLIGITRDLSIDTKNLLTEDLEHIKQKDPGKDAPLQVLTKEELKELIGRSTDCGDMFMMRMMYELSHPLVFDFFSPSNKEKEIKKVEKDEIPTKEEEKIEFIKQIKEGNISLSPAQRRNKTIQINNNL